MHTESVPAQSSRLTLDLVFVAAVHRPAAFVQMGCLHFVHGVDLFGRHVFGAAAVQSDRHVTSLALGVGVLVLRQGLAGTYVFKLSERTWLCHAVGHGW